MSNIPELEQRILSELEEAQAEEIYTMLNTVFEPREDPRQVTEFLAALIHLVKLDYVLMSLNWVYDEKTARFDDPIDLDKVDSLDLLANSQGIFRFDKGRGYWMRVNDSNDWRCPVIVTTEAGYQMADRILDERGYQWWLQE
jgi:hypothetical protein